MIISQCTFLVDYIEFHLVIDCYIYFTCSSTKSSKTFGRNFSWC